MYSQSADREYLHQAFSITEFFCPPPPPPRPKKKTHYTQASWLHAQASARHGDSLSIAQRLELNSAKRTGIRSDCTLDSHDGGGWWEQVVESIVIRQVVSALPHVHKQTLTDLCWRDRPWRVTALPPQDLTLGRKVWATSLLSMKPFLTFMITGHLSSGQHSTARHSHSTAQHSTAQHSTAQHSTLMVTG